MFEVLLKKIAASLERYQIPYMIIGGQAVLLYGEPRLTRDIDVTLGIEIEGLQKIIKVVNELGLDIVVDDVVSFVKRTMVLPAIHAQSGIRVDFIFSFTPYEQEAINRAKKVMIQGQPVAFASVEDVIIHKVFAGRARDIDDVRAILIKNPDIDIEYIKNWLTEFDRSLNGDFTKKFDKIRKNL